MKRPSLPRQPLAGLALLALAASALTGCRKPAPENQEQEIERRVAQRLEEERLALKRDELAQKEQALSDRERELEERRRQEPPAPAATAASAPAGEAEPEEEAAPREPLPVDASGTGSLDVFYQSLAPYGAWLDTAAYGPVWRPNAALRDPGWRPYTLGRWAYTDEGWAWVSDEPFGWAVYHYGRWTRLIDAGWVWVPGEQWAPAWVAFRNSDQYVGWAPLPPESRHAGGSLGSSVDEEYGIAPAYYNFIPVEEFGYSDLGGYIVDSARNPVLIGSTVNVTNIIINQTNVINYGPSFTFIQKRSRRPLNVWKIDRRPHFHGERPAHASHGKLQFTAPRIDPHRKPAERPKVTGRIEHVQIDRKPLLPGFQIIAHGQKPCLCVHHIHGHTSPSDCSMPV